MCYKEDTLELVRKEHPIDPRHLGTAVLARALADATEYEPLLDNKFTKPSWIDVAEAQAFLTNDSEDLRFWCECIGVDVEFVIKSSKQAIQSGVVLLYDDIMKEPTFIDSGV